MGEAGEAGRQSRAGEGVIKGSGESKGGGREKAAEGRRIRQKGSQRGRDRAGEAPLTEAGGEVWAGTMSGRTDTLEGAVGIGTDAALAEVFLAALVHVCGTTAAHLRCLAF